MTTFFRQGLALALVVALAAGVAQPSRAEGSLAGAYLAARQAVQSNDFDEASEYFFRALDLDPGNPRLLENAVLAAVAAGEFERAITAARRLDEAGVESRMGQIVLLAHAIAESRFAEARASLEDRPRAGQLVDGLITAWAYLGEGRVEDALSAFDTVAETGGLRTFGLYHKALALATVGDFEGAEEILSGAAGEDLRLTRRGTLARLQILSQLQRFDTASEVIEARFGADPEADIVALRAAVAAGESVPFDVARNPTEGVAEVFYTVAGALQSEASDSFMLGFARMAQYLRPGHADAVLMVAELLERMDQHDLATRAYDRIPREAAQYPAAQVGRAEALYRSGETDAALELLAQLARALPEAVEVHNARGDLLRNEGRFGEAASAYDRAVALISEPEQRHWIVYYARGISYERTGDWDAAEADFRQALELNPGQPHALNYLGYSMLEMGINLDEALDMIQRAVEAEPSNGYITDSLGWAQYRLGQYEEAVGTMERAVELEPADPIINDHLGDVYWAVGRVREAEFQWRRALSLGPAEDLDMDRIRRKLEIGLDRALEEEGAEPLERITADGG